MSAPWGGPDGVCPKCGSADWMPKTDESFASCNDCGFTDYSEWTLTIIREVQREQAQCKQILGYVPEYSVAIEKGLIKP